MKIPVLLLANQAAVNNELLDIAGGGWENFSCPAFPWGIAGVLCGVVEVDSSERDEPQRLSFSVFDHDGQELGVKASMLVRATRGDGPVRVPFAWPFMFVVDGPLLVEFRVLDAAGGVAASVLLPVRAVPSSVD